MTDSPNCQELADRLAICELASRYFDLLDSRQITDIPQEIFTANAEFQPMGWVGHDGLAAGLRKTIETWEATAHVMSNTTVAIRGDHADARYYVTVWHWSAENSAQGPRRPAEWVSVGAFDDKLVRLAAGWRVARRELTIVGLPVAAGRWIS